MADKIYTNKTPGMELLVTRLSINICSYIDTKTKYGDSLIDFDPEKKKYSEKQLKSLEEQMKSAYTVKNDCGQNLNAEIIADNLKILYGHVLKNRAEEHKWNLKSYESYLKDKEDRKKEEK